jgi:mannose-6-phosphate isomerase-like protein (cupin superfamily)
MIVRNLKDKEVLETTYIAHGGAVARMVLDQRTLKEIGFLASAILDKGKKIEAHVDPMEEIYFVIMGEGQMSVGDETRHVIPGDAIWIPAGVPHALENTGNDLLFLMVVASPNWQENI